MADDSRAAISISDPAGRYFYANQRFRALFWPSDAPLEGRIDADVFAPDEAAGLVAGDELARGGTGPRETAVALRSTDGVRAFSVERFPLKDASGAPWAVCRVATDVTERHRAEEALAENREKYRALSEAAFESIFISERGICLEQNRTAELTFGYSNEDAIGRSGIEWIAPEDRELVMRNMLAGHEDPYQVTALRKDGTRFPAAIRGRMMSYQGRSVRVTSLTDITAMKRAEDELRQAQKMDLVGRLAGGIAHDFNNVLAAIMAEASLALTDLADGTATVEESLAAIVAAAERGASLTQRLLTFARPDRERPREVVELGALVNELLPMLRRLTPASIELVVQPAEPCFSVVDASQIEQVVVNLIVNGRDAISGPGRLVVSIAPAEFDAEAAALLGVAPGPYVRLTVADNGAGIPAALRGRIFEPFFTTKPIGQGTGLGLSVVLGIATQHQGAVTVDSTVGAGTRFDVLLPRSEAAAARPAPRVVTSARARPGETILLAEDEPAVRRGATRILERAGYRVLEVEDGLQAIDVYLRHAGEVSLVILDAVMPRMGGRRVYDELFAHRGPALRVLFCSGYAAEETDPELHLPAGCRYLAKPYHSSDLLSLVRAMLDDS